MDTPNLDHPRSNKAKVIYLVKLLQQRSGKTFEKIRKEMSHFVGITINRGSFENLFRQKPDIHTHYDYKIILGLICAFQNQLPPKKQITSLEAVLLMIYSNNFTYIHELSDFYELAWVLASTQVYASYDNEYWIENLDNLKTVQIEEILITAYNQHRDRLQAQTPPS